MKKTKALILVLTLVLVLVGCSKDKVRTFTMQEEGISLTISYTYEGDIVKSQTANTTMDYSLLGVETKEDAKALLAPIAEQYKDVKGLTHNIEYGKTGIIEDLKTDYNKIVFDEIKDIPGMYFEGVDADGKMNAVSMNMSAKMLLDGGFAEITK